MSISSPSSTLHSGLLILCLLGVVAILVASARGFEPVFFFRPPITRRSKFFEVPHSSGCSDGVQGGSWTDWPLPVSCRAQGGKYATCGETAERRWVFSSRALECGARRNSRQDIQSLLGGKWVVFAGDSITRMLYGSLLRAAGSPGQEVKLKHQDFEYELEGGIRATFLWRAYPSNLTDQYNSWRGEKAVPDMIVSSVALWHLLHYTSPEGYGQELARLKGAADAYLTEAGQKRPLLLLGAATDNFTNRQPTEEKRRNMTPQNVDAYNKVLVQQGALAPAGPFQLLDMFELTRGCGEECSFDGIHSVDAVYDTALQLLLSIYRIQLQ